MILKLYFARKFSGECRKCRLPDPIPDLLIQISGVEAKNVYYTQVSQAIFRQSVVQTTLSNWSGKKVLTGMKKNIFSCSMFSSYE